MADEKDQTMGAPAQASWRWWRVIPVAAATAVAVVAWRWPAWLDSRTGSLIAVTVTTLALAAASVAFLETRKLPLVARLLALTVAIYAIVALLQGAVAGTTFREMLLGASGWQPLPSWLRGAFIGGCVVLPLAAVVQAVKTGLRGWRSSSSTAWRELNQALVYALCAATALATWTPSRHSSRPLGNAVAFAVPATPPPATPSAALPVVNSGQAGDVDPVAFARRTDALADRISRVDWDVDVRADALASGVEPAFAYVRDAIRYEAYPGVLRGAAGTYTGRAGNAADRALLLAHVLERKKIHTRFAIGTLDQAAQQRLWERVFDTTIPGIPHSNPSTTSDPDSTTFSRRVRARATRDYGVVRGALGDRLPPVTAPSRDAVLAEMNPHVWIQAEVDGGWVNLDPSFPDAKPGTTNTTVERTVSELPPDLYQRVAIRLKVEQLSHGALTQTTVLDSTANAVDLIDRQIFITHVAGKPMVMANIGAALGGYNTWTPALWVAGESTFGTSFTIDETGAPAPVTPGDTQAPGSGGLAGVIDALSGRPEASPTTTTPTAPVFVAEWLEFELGAPGGQREVTRRVLVDRGSAAWRAKSPLSAPGLARLERADNGPTAMRALHNVWLSGGPHDLAAYTEAMQDLAYQDLDEAFPEGTTAQPRTRPTGSQADDREFGESVWPIALQNFAWMVWTDHGVIPQLNDTPGLRLYTDRPRIAIFTVAADRTGTVQFETDLRRDDLREVALDTVKPGVAAEKKLWFGLLQGAFEHEMLASTIAAAGGDPTTVETTSARLSDAGVMLLAATDALPSGPRLPHPESAARLSASLSAGNLIVAPVGGVDARGMWWEIAAGRGDTRAVGPLELHAGYGRGPGYNPNHDLPRNVKPPQQNPYGGQKPSYTPEAAKEARDAQRAARNAKKAADSAAQYRKNQLARQAESRAGGNEYSTLVKMILIVGAVAYTAVGIAVVYVTYLAAEAAISGLTE
jgi:hypothetical protein